MSSAPDTLPKSADARRTDGRARVLRAATLCMVRRGYFGTSIRDIAEEAGMTSAALYHHFSSKQQILADIMTTALTDARRVTEEALADAAVEPRERLAALSRAWALFHAQRRNEALVGASEIRSLDAGHRGAIVRMRDEQEQLFRSVIEAGIETGVFASSDPVVTARALIAMGNSIATWFDPEGPSTPESVADEIVRLSLRLVTP